MHRILCVCLFMASIFSKLYANECALSVLPALKDLKLKHYKLEKDPSSTNGIRESGELADGTRIQVQSSGCEKLRLTYQFTYTDAKSKVSNSKHWLSLAETSFAAIQKPTLARFIKKQNTFPLKKNISVDAMLTLADSKISQTKKGTTLIFETELEVLLE